MYRLSVIDNLKTMLSSIRFKRFALLCMLFMSATSIAYRLLLFASCFGVIHA